MSQKTEKSERLKEPIRRELVGVAAALKGYEKSPGADLELDVAEMCGLEVEYEEEPDDE